MHLQINKYFPCYKRKEERFYLCIKPLNIRPEILNISSKWVDMEEGWYNSCTKRELSVVMATFASNWQAGNKGRLRNHKIPRQSRTSSRPHHPLPHLSWLLWRGPPKVTQWSRGREYSALPGGSQANIYFLDLYGTTLPITEKPNSLIQFPSQAFLSQKLPHERVGKGWAPSWCLLRF